MVDRYRADYAKLPDTRPEHVEAFPVQRKAHQAAIVLTPAHYCALFDLSVQRPPALIRHGARQPPPDTYPVQSATYPDLSRPLRVNERNSIAFKLDAHIFLEYIFV